MNERPIEDLNAAAAFRDSLIECPDAMGAGNAPLWYGWAITDAFLAGMDHARKQIADAPKPYLVTKTKS